jgi:hypothetical protein
MKGYLGAVEDLQGNVEPLYPIINPRRTRETNGEYSFSGIVFKSEDGNSDNGLAFSKLTNRSVIHIGNDSFRIRKYKRSMKGKRPYVEIQQALHVFFDIIDDMQYGYLSGTINFVQALNHIFTPTIWTWVNQAATNTVKVDKWGRKRCLNLLDDAIEMFGVEYTIDLPTLTVTFKNKVGYDTEAQFRYNHNIKVYEETIDDSVIVTYVEGYGGNGLKRTYKSPNSSRYPRLIHGDPIEDEDILTASEMDEQLKSLIVDDPDFQIQADILQLKEIQSDGKEINMHNYSLGDYVYVMYEPLGVDIQIRVSKIIDNPLEPDDKMFPPVLTLTNIKRNKNFTAMQANLNQIKKVMKDVTDGNGNLSLQIKRLYRNSNHYSDNTGDWYISPDDPNAYVHIGAGGVDIHKGLLRVERESGFATIIGGRSTYDFAIFEHSPNYVTGGMRVEGRWYKNNTTIKESGGFFQFKHTARYLRVTLAFYCDDGNSGSLYIDSTDGVNLLTHNTANSQGNSLAEDGQDFVIDFGDPTGTVKKFYVRSKSNTANKDICVRIIGAWIYG